MSTQTRIVPPSSPARRSLGEQLHRSPRTVHAGWFGGLATLLTAGAVGGLGPAGALFLIVLFLPPVIAYRRERLSFGILFGTLFLPTWPLALWLACRRTHPHPA